jgi:deazaflavin-dependent oxidoreductase (nitroreductase family)
MPGKLVMKMFYAVVPGDLSAKLKATNSVHRLILGLSGGRLGWEAKGMPVLELTTIGRKSGQQRSVMLTSPLSENGNMVIVASRGGDDTHPAWFLNLRDNPKVEVSVKGEAKKPMIARIATPEERARLWPQIAGKYSNYAGYQMNTDREIPLVVLDPIA